MLMRSVIGIQRISRVVRLEEIAKKRFSVPYKSTFREKEQNLLTENILGAGQYYSLLQRRNYDSPPKPNDSKQFIYKGIAKWMNTVDTVSTSKDYLLAKRTFSSFGEWCKMAYQKYFLGHWWVQHTIKEFNRKLTNARRERAVKQIVK